MERQAWCSTCLLNDDGTIDPQVGNCAHIAAHIYPDEVYADFTTKLRRCVEINSDKRDKDLYVSLSDTGYSPDNFSTTMMTAYVPVKQIITEIERQMEANPSANKETTFEIESTGRFPHTDPRRNEGDNTAPLVLTFKPYKSMYTWKLTETLCRPSPELIDNFYKWFETYERKTVILPDYLRIARETE